MQENISAKERCMESTWVDSICTFKLNKQIFQLGNSVNELIKIRSFEAQFS